MTANRPAAPGDRRETLVHGDPWMEHVLVASGAGRVRVCLIGGDEAAPGPIAFALSMFVLRCNPGHRPWILDAYRSAVGRLAGWQLAPASVLNSMFDTAAAHARLASLLVWSLAAADDRSGWLPERLAEMLQSLDAVEPVFPAR